jgi:anti-sigma factor RsiW
MVCAEFVERVTEYLEGALPSAQGARVEAHLSGCSPCTAHLEQIHAMRGVSARIADGEPGPGIDMSVLLEAYRTRSTGRDAP